MSRIKVLTALLLAGLFALLIPLSIVLAQGGGGTASLQDSDNTEFSNKLSDQLSIELMDLDTLPPNMVYEGWLVSDDGSRKESVGILAADANGNVSQSFMLMAGDEATGENLFAAFDKFVVTIEPVPDSDPGPSDKVLGMHQIPTASVGHIRYLTYSASGKPAYGAGNFHEGMPKGISVGLREQTGVAGAHAGLAFDASDLTGVQQHSCHVVNITEGSGGANYDGSCGDPGDGFGVLSYAADAATYAALAASGASDDAVIVSNGQRVINASGQASTSASQARDEALAAKASTDITAAKIHAGNAMDLLERAMTQATEAYTASQEMGTYTMDPGAAPPDTGDYNVPKLAFLSLLLGAALLVSGTLVYRRNRATS